MSRAILVTGATGKQGGSVINALLKTDANFQILALTRDTQSGSAKKLVQKSSKIKLVQGNLDNCKEIFEKAKTTTSAPIWGVFSVQTMMSKGASLNEEQQGKALVDASVENGVKHFVYTSVDRGGSKSDNDPTNVPHFISKHNVEQHLFEKTRNGSMDWTVLRPVAFFENLVPGFVGKVFTTSWQMRLREEQKLQLIATSDIGFFAADAFMKPDEFKNTKLSLAGDELTFEQFSSIFKEKTGQPIPITYHFIAAIINWLSTELGTMFKWFRDRGYGADIAGLRKLHPELKDFKTWLEKESQFTTR